MNSTEISENDVRKTFDQFLEALKKADFQALDKLYAFDYRLVRANGQILTKSQILEDLKIHKMQFTSFETSNIQIKTRDSVGLLSVENRSTAVRDENQVRARDQQFVVFYKSEKQITITHFQTTNILTEVIAGAV